MRKLHVLDTHSSLIMLNFREQNISVIPMMLPGINPCMKWLVISPMIQKSSIKNIPFIGKSKVLETMQS